MQCHSKLTEMRMYEHILNIRDGQRRKGVCVMGALSDCSDGEET